MARDAPHHVDGLSLMVPLQDQYARPLGVGGVLFNDLTFARSYHDIPNQNTIGGKLIITMIRDHDLSPCHQF